MDIMWCQINNEVFAALIGRIEDPKTTLLTFTSSNNVCTGAKKVIHSRIACRIAASILQEKGYEVSVRNFKVQNIVASAYTGFPLRLEAIAVEFTPDATFDPDVFPGLIYRMKFPKIVFLLFREVITGGKKIEDLRKAVKIFYKTVLVPYRDYSETLNYVQAPPVGNLATIVEQIVEQFGDEQDMAENEAADDLGEDFDDLSDSFSKIDLYEDAYEKQLASIELQMSSLEIVNVATQ